MSIHETEIMIASTVRIEHRSGEITRVLRPVLEANGSIRWVDITHAFTANELAALSAEIVENEGNQRRKVSGF